MNTNHPTDHLFSGLRHKEVTPPAHIWERIEGKLEQKRTNGKVVFWQRTAVAAALALLLTAGITLWKWPQPQQITIASSTTVNDINKKEANHQADIFKTDKEVAEDTQKMMAVANLYDHKTNTANEQKAGKREVSKKQPSQFQKKAKFAQPTEQVASVATTSSTDLVASQTVSAKRFKITTEFRPARQVEEKSQTAPVIASIVFKEAQQPQTPVEPADTWQNENGFQVKGALVEKFKESEQKVHQLKEDLHKDVKGLVASARNNVQQFISK